MQVTKIVFSFSDGSTTTLPVTDQQPTDLMEATKLLDETLLLIRKMYYTQRSNAGYLRKYIKDKGLHEDFLNHIRNC